MLTCSENKVTRKFAWVHGPFKHKKFREESSSGSEGLGRRRAPRGRGRRGWPRPPGPQVLRWPSGPSPAPGPRVYTPSHDSGFPVPMRGIYACRGDAPRAWGTAAVAGAHVPAGQAVHPLPQAPRDNGGVLVAACTPTPLGLWLGALSPGEAPCVANTGLVSTCVCRASQTPSDADTPRHPAQTTASARGADAETGHARGRFGADSRVALGASWRGSGGAARIRGSPMPRTNGTRAPCQDGSLEHRPLSVDPGPCGPAEGLAGRGRARVHLAA